MFSPRRSHLALSLLCLVLAGHPALGGPRQSQPVRLPGAVQTSGPVALGTPLCQLGQWGTAFAAENVVYYDGADTYFTWLKSDSCPVCTSNSMLTLQNAHVSLFFPAAPCTLLVQFRVVAATIPPNGCRNQDALTTMCDPFAVQLTNQVINATIDFSVPFPDSCKMFNTFPLGNGEAFLGVTFLGVNAACSDSLHKPRLITKQFGKQCTSYNPVGDNNIDFVLNYATGNPIMYVDVDQCVSTPTRRRTWGELKTRYR
jgi:hypothetical protein